MPKYSSLSSSNRKDGRFVSTPGLVHHLLSQTPELAFDPDMSAEEHRKWKRQVKRKLRDLLAFPDGANEPAPILISDEPRDGYRIQKWELYPEPYSVVPFLMLIPDGASESNCAPAVLCMPGSQQPKEAMCGEPWNASWVNNFGEHEFMAKHFVRAGFVAVAFDNPGTCELAHEDNRCHFRNALQLIWLGRTYEGLSTFHKLCALRWLRTLDSVDSTRIAACGHSLGAKPALLLGLLESSVRAVIWNGMASDWRKRDAVTNLSRVAPWHYMPGFARYFDYMDLMAALAPKPLLITEGGRLDDHLRIRKAFKLNGVSSNFKVTFMPNFADPGKRYRKKMPEGIRPDGYGQYANYDGDHYFKEDVAVPWLSKMMGVV
jgi:hypothetical protein